MPETIVLTLPSKLRSAVDEVASQEGVLAQELISKALETYLFLRQFRLLSEKMTVKAEAQGIFTDQDVFDLVS